MSARPAQNLSRTKSALPYARSSVVGAAFAVGWTPCLGPILGTVLTLAASSATVIHGALLLACWSAGLGVPFLATGLAIERVMSAIRKLRPIMPVLEVAGGVLVVFVGILIFMDRFTIFNTYFTGGVSNVTGAEGRLGFIDVGGPFGFIAAFAAGVIAFLSPCCLPLVPAYVAHLAGVSVDPGTMQAKRGLTMRHAAAFVVGFSFVFVFLGASVGALGYVVRDQLPTIQKIAGVLLMIMGLNLAGVLHIPLLNRTYQIEVPAGQEVRSP